MPCRDATSQQRLKELFHDDLHETEREDCKDAALLLLRDLELPHHRQRQKEQVQIANRVENSVDEARDRSVLDASRRTDDQNPALAALRNAQRANGDSH